MYPGHYENAHIAYYISPSPSLSQSTLRLRAIFSISGKKKWRNRSVMKASSLVLGRYNTMYTAGWGCAECQPEWRRPASALWNTTLMYHLDQHLFPTLHSQSTYQPCNYQRQEELWTPLSGNSHFKWNSSSQFSKHYEYLPIIHTIPSSNTTWEQFIHIRVPQFPFHALSLFNSIKQRESMQYNPCVVCSLNIQIEGQIRKKQLI